MTIHPSSGALSPGTYKGFIENDQNGGIAHLKRMGVNAIQFLPIWDYANVEIPYKKEPMVCLMIGTHMKEITGDICRLFHGPRELLCIRW